MPLMSNMERRGLQQGLEQGLQQGLQQSRQEISAMVIEVLEIRLGEISTEIKEKINKIEDISGLKQFHRQALTVDSIAEFQEKLS